MARVQPTGLVLNNHPPQAYYEEWAFTHGLSLTKYPYIKTDFDPSKEKMLPFAVYDFDYMRDEFGHTVAMIKVRYKSLFSKSQFEVIAYL